MWSLFLLAKNKLNKNSPSLTPRTSLSTFQFQILCVNGKCSFQFENKKNFHCLTELFFHQHSKYEHLNFITFQNWNSSIRNQVYLKTHKKNYKQKPWFSKQTNKKYTLIIKEIRQNISFCHKRNLQPDMTVRKKIK
jgi:hypothetical protein